MKILTLILSAAATVAVARDSNDDNFKKAKNTWRDSNDDNFKKAKNTWRVYDDFDYTEAVAEAEAENTWRDCKDENQDCSLWKSKLGCSPSAMRSQCRNTCGLCGTSSDADAWMEPDPGPWGSDADAWMEPDPGPWGSDADEWMDSDSWGTEAMQMSGWIQTPG